MVRKDYTLKFPLRGGITLGLLALLVLASCRQFSSDTPAEAPVPAEEPEITVPEMAAEETSETGALWTPYDDSQEVAANQDHPIPRMRYKLIQSRVLDKNEVFLPLYPEVEKMTASEYERLRPLILDQSIPQIQQQVRQGVISYEDLCRFYLYRIYRYELDNATTLNTVIALNSGVIEEARLRDADLKANPDAPRHPIFGMPVLLKDNINTEGMPTTAGAIALKENQTGDAFIVKQLKEKGALILGKVNLSEWAYWMCDGCPVGYSAVGGQTLNPYGRREFETGGSSSGSGTAVAAGYAIAAVGTETSGSILSPSGKNSIVGFKPTLGMLSRTGIVPISGALDTPGPMTRNVTDNGILLDALMGYDVTDILAFQVSWEDGWYLPEGITIRGKRLGVFQSLMESDTLYRQRVEQLRAAGAEIIPFTPPEAPLEGMSTQLNYDMKRDLPGYLGSQIRDTIAVTVRSVADVVAFNREDPELRAPYGQARLEGIVSDNTSEEQYDQVRKALKDAGRKFLGTPWEEHGLDAILSVDITHGRYAAVARYPALSIPMGYRESGEPAGLTIIGRGFQIPELLRLAMACEQVLQARRPPRDYLE
jgi:amidase